MAYTDIDKSDDYFTTFLWTGDGSTSPRSHTGVGLQADMMWSKIRSSGHQHNLVDTVRGVNQRLLMPSDNNDEDTTCTHGHFDSLDSDGFTTTNAGGNWNVNTSGETYVGWFWKAGGTASSNSNGSITSSVSASTDAGFSIVSYTGTGSNATVGHGLGSTPSMIIAKDRDGARDWTVYHKSLGATKWIQLSDTSASQTGSPMWQDTEPTSSLFSIGTYAQINTSSSKYIAYCFSEVKGFSKFGSYTGNGNADGNFVYLGFKPALVIVKNSSLAGENWVMLDNKRDPKNPTNLALFPNLNNAEGGTYPFDFVSNGFKIRDSSASYNRSGDVFIFMAFAESPFVTSSGIPTTAR